MTINEVFPNPVVKQVIFQIRFPHLFFLPDLIGTFQVKIMDRFPESSQHIRRAVFFTDQADQEKLAELAQQAPDEEARQMWQFRSKEGVQLNLTTSSLSLESTSHKTYRLGKEEHFRDLIELACRHFFELTGLPLVTRVGLRYVDNCPIPADLSQFDAYYNTAFPLARFPLGQSRDMTFKTVITRDDCKLRYVESLQDSEEKRTLVLDFDAWTEKVGAGQILSVTDKLHDIISAEFESTVKDPVYDYMRQPRENANVAN